MLILMAINSCGVNASKMITHIRSFSDNLFTSPTNLFTWTPRTCSRLWQACTSVEDVRGVVACTTVEALDENESKFVGNENRFAGDENGFAGMS